MRIAATVLSIIMLLLGGGMFLISLIKGKGNYDDLLEPLDDKEFKLKSMLPAGLVLDEMISPTDILPTNLKTVLRKYESRIVSQLIELYGEQDREDYCDVHRAERWVMALLADIFLSLFALISCSNGEYSTALVFAVLAPVSLCVAPFIVDTDLKSKIEQRRDKIQLEFPEFVNKLILLVNAGSTIPKAWEKIVSESKSDSPLFRELRYCMADIRSGKPEAQAYEEFARRCKIKEVVKMVSVIILNLRKGGSEIIPTLRAQADECWEARKATARRLGEKASSKLMLPMAVMLLGIIMIVALPAILSLAGM